MAAVLAAGVGLAGRAPGAPDLVAYREAVVARHRPVSLDPLVAREDPATRDLGRLLYRGLVRLGDDGLPAPDLAATWTVSGDGLRYQFDLAPARWSDGSQITAADVAATVAAIQDPGRGDPRLAAPWKGATLTVEGRRTLSVTLPEPRAAFLLALSQLPILPAAVLRGHAPTVPVPPSTQPLPTSGPYRVSAADASRVLLEANPWAPRPPRLSPVELRWEPSPEAALRDFVGGRVDGVLVGTPAERRLLAAMPHTTVHDMVTFRFVDLLLDTRRPGLDDLTVRQAIAEAVDRRALLVGPLGGMGVPQTGAVPAGIRWMSRDGSGPVDPALASRALDAAGWQLGPDGVRRRGATALSFTLSVPNVSPLPAVAAELHRQLLAIGVATTVRPLPAADYEDTVVLPGAFDLALAVWDNGPDADVSSYWRSNATPPSGVNVSGLAPDPFLDQALDVLATENDLALRRAAAQRVDQRLAEEVPAVFLYAPKVSLAVRSSVVVRLPPAGDPEDRFTDVVAWHRVG